MLWFPLVSAAAENGQSLEAANLVSEVDPFIGTGRGPGGSENLFPGAAMPFGMVQLSPDTESHGYGYHSYQRSIKGFSMTHMSGPGCANEGDVFFTATSGRVDPTIRGFESPYSHATESASPGYYRVLLARWGIDAELSATKRAGIATFTYPAGKAADFLLPISHTLDYTVAARVRIDGDRELSGYVENRAFCGNKQSYRVYFVITFDRPFFSYGTWRHATRFGAPALSAGNREAVQVRHGGWIGAYVGWPAEPHPQRVVARIGISYVDLAGARNNLRQEAAGRSFSEIRDAAAAAWNDELGLIRVSGGTPKDTRIFYTALYHCLLMPSLSSDADGRYLGFDGHIHRVGEGHAVYANFSGWDVYRSEMPLLALIEPRRMEDMAQSIVLMYEQGGWIGRWPQINLYTNVMAGSPLTVVLATAWLDGLHGFDMKAAWRGMLLDATQSPAPGHAYAGEEGMEWINRLHYVPNDKVSYGSVSQIQEDSIAYASLYYLAKELGHSGEAKRLHERALYERNVFDRRDGYFRPRNANGRWSFGFFPARRGHGFIEGTGWHYQWLAPADMAWLIRAVGVVRFNRRLLRFFDYRRPGWHNRYYNPYNETDLEAPFEFNFSGMPWQTQRVVRRILAENYTTASDGIPGNDDCGEMSSWAVLSMMGFYSIDPASRAYELASPLFSRIEIRLKPPYTGTSFTVRATDRPGALPYIQGVVLDGRPQSRNWISFDEIRSGGTLDFRLGAEPNESWGSSPADAPPSLSDSTP